MKIKKTKKAKIIRNAPEVVKTSKGLTVVEINLIGIMFIALSFVLFPLLQPQNPELRSEKRLVSIENMREARRFQNLERNPVWTPPVPVQIWQNTEPVSPKEIKLPSF